jgi:hypothetical protein
VFTNTRSEPIEPNSLLRHWYACQRALEIRVRGLYSTKDTLSAPLRAGVKIAWLERQTGVSYATLRRHYGQWMPSKVASELMRFRGLAPTLFSTEAGRIAPAPAPRRGQFSEVRGKSTPPKCERGDS